MQLGRALDRVLVVIERMHARPQPPSRQAEQTAAGADVEKRLPLQLAGPEHVRQRCFGVLDAVFVEQLEKLSPVAAELEPGAGWVRGLASLTTRLHNR